MQAGQTARLRRIQWVAVGFLTLVGIINYLDRSGLSIANGAIRQEMRLSPTEMGLLLSAFSLAYAFAQLPVGVLLDRFGPRRMLAAGMLFWSIAQAVCGYVTTLSQFVTMRAILGVGEAPQFPAGAKVISSWFNLRERGLPTGIFVASSCIAPCIAPPLLTALMLGVGWRWMFVITGALGIVIAIAWYLIYRDRDEQPLEAAERAYLDSDQEQSEQAPITFAEWRGLFTHPTTWGIILGFMGVIYMVWLYLTWLPSYFEHERGLTVARTGWIVAIPYLFGTLGMLSAGRAVDSLMQRGMSAVASRKWPVCGGLIGAAVFTVPAAYTPSLTLAVIYICLAMYFVNMASAGSWTLISVIVPRRQSASLGSLMNFGGYFAGSFGPIVTGRIIQTTNSYVDALLASAAIAAIAAVAYFILVRRPLPGLRRQETLA